MCHLQRARGQRSTRCLRSEALWERSRHHIPEEELEMDDEDHVQMWINELSSSSGDSTSCRRGILRLMSGCPLTKVIIPAGDDFLQSMLGYERVITSLGVCRAAEFTADFSEFINRSEPKGVDSFIHSEDHKSSFWFIVSTSTPEETVTG